MHSKAEGDDNASFENKLSEEDDEQLSKINQNNGLNVIIL